MKRSMVLVLWISSLCATPDDPGKGKMYELVSQEDEQQNFADKFTQLIRQQREQIEEIQQQIERTYGTRDPKKLWRVYLNAIQEEDHSLLETLKFLHVKDSLKALKKTSNEAFWLMQHCLEEHLSQAVKFLVHECGFTIKQTNFNGYFDHSYSDRKSSHSGELLLMTLALGNYKLTEKDKTRVERWLPKPSHDENSDLSMSNETRYQGIIQSEKDLVRFFSYLKEYNVQKAVNYSVGSSWGLLKHSDTLSLEDAARILVFLKNYPLPTQHNAFKWALHVIGDREWVTEVTVDDVVHLKDTLEHNGFSASEDPLLDMYMPVSQYGKQRILASPLRCALARYFISQGALDTRPKKYILRRAVLLKGDTDIARLIVQNSEHEADSLQQDLHAQYAECYDDNQLLPEHKRLPLPFIPVPPKKEEVEVAASQSSTVLPVLASTSALADTPRSELIAAVTKSSVRQRKSGTVATQEVGTIH